MYAVTFCNVLRKFITGIRLDMETDRCAVGGPVRGKRKDCMLTHEKD